nr:MAG TPA: hypothetical protein [Crassvirales sp.]
MGDEDLYVGDIRNYYNCSSCILYPDKYAVSVRNDNFPDGKAQRRERRAKAIRRRKGRL